MLVCFLFLYACEGKSEKCDMKWHESVTCCKLEYLLFHFVFPVGCCEVHEGIVVMYDETGKLLLVYFLVNIYKLNLCGTNVWQFAISESAMVLI